jgi:hypothetical protein
MKIWNFGAPAIAMKKVGKQTQLAQRVAKTESAVATIVVNSYCLLKSNVT